MRETLRSGEVDYTFDDFRELARAIPPTIWQFANILGWLLLTGTIVTYGLARFVGTPFGLIDFLTGIGAAAALIVLSSTSVRARVWRRTLRRNHLYAPQTFVVCDDSFKVFSSTGDLTLPWTSILSTKLKDDRLFAFISRHSAYIIPRRAFANDAEFSAFAEFVEEHFKASRTS